MIIMTFKLRPLGLNESSHPARLHCSKHFEFGGCCTAIFTPASCSRNTSSERAELFSTTSLELPLPFNGFILTKYYA
jgi:hypothetical protein